MGAAKDLVPNAPFREAFEKSDMGIAELAKEVGFMAAGRPDMRRLKRTLGTLPAKGGKTYEQISYDNAVKLCKALDLDPIDCGV